MTRINNRIDGKIVGILLSIIFLDFNNQTFLEFLKINLEGIQSWMIFLALVAQLKGKIELK